MNRLDSRIENIMVNTNDFTPPWNLTAVFTSPLLKTT